MKAILLAAGYGTRLRPLTDRLPKELLQVGGRPIIDWILESVSAVPEIDEVHVVTNATKMAAFEEWASGRDVTLHNDSTTSNEDRLGATGDIRFVLDQAGLAGDDLLVVAGDNLFEFSLVDYVAFWRGKAGGSAIAVHELADPGARVSLRRRRARRRRPDSRSRGEAGSSPQQPRVDRDLPLRP